MSDVVFHYRTYMKKTCYITVQYKKVMKCSEAVKVGKIVFDS